MRAMPRTLFSLAVVGGLVVSLGWVAPAWGQGSELERRRALLEGTELFRRILFDKNCESLQDYKDLIDNPDRCILIVLGDANVIRNVPDRETLTWFLREAGGAALIASDRPMDADARGQLEAVAGVVIDGRTLEGFAEDDCYRQPYCPFLKPTAKGIPSLFASPFAAPYKVATNLPSWLIPTRRGEAVRPRTVKPIADLPPHPGIMQGKAFVPFDPSMTNPFPGMGATASPLFAVGGDAGKGRLLVLADHSIFINEMMLPPPTETNNVEFTEACVDWLKGPKGERTHVLFVENGTIKTKFDIPLRSVNLPIEEAAKALFDRRNHLLVAAEDQLADLEDRDSFNRFVFGFLDEVGPMKLVGYLLSIGAMALLLWCLVRGFRRRPQPDPSVPILAYALGKRLPLEPVSEQRHTELFRQDNMWEPATLLTRRWFVRLGVERTDGPPPAFRARGGLWRRLVLVRRLRRLWHMACGNQPRRISAPALWQLQRELDELRGEWDRGTWQVRNEGPG